MDQEERIIRLEELAYFQEERLRELNEALTAQQQQIGRASCRERV